MLRMTGLATLLQAGNPWLQVPSAWMLWRLHALV